MRVAVSRLFLPCKAFKIAEHVKNAFQKKEGLLPYCYPLNLKTFVEQSSSVATGSWREHRCKPKQVTFTMCLPAGPEAGDSLNAAVLSALVFVSTDEGRLTVCWADVG